MVLTHKKIDAKAIKHHGKQHTSITRNSAIPFPTLFFLFGVFCIHGNQRAQSTQVTMAKVHIKMYSVMKWFGNYQGCVKIIFPLCLLLVFVSFVYFTYVATGPDPCKVWEDKLGKFPLEAKDEDKEWWEYVCSLEKEWDKEPEYVCEDLRHIANYQVCFDKPYRPTPPCLVYSFGIDYDFRFEDKMALLGCEVYSFDPSMNTDSHNRSERVHFFNIGIGTSNSNSFRPKQDSYTAKSKRLWQIRTLPALKKMLGHENRVINVLKMDIETYEWNVTKKFVTDRSFQQTKQLVMEWHIFPNEPARTEYPIMFGTYQRLKRNGWKQFYSSVDSRSHSYHHFQSQMNNGLLNTRI